MMHKFPFDEKQRKIHLPAVWALAAITIGGRIAGPLGMLFAVPVFSSAYELIREATAAKEAVLAKKAHI